MPEFRLEHKLQAPPALAFSALGEILHGIAHQEAGWKGFAFHIDLGDAGFPDVGYIAIPIHLTLAPVKSGINQYELVVRAVRHHESFPVFTGAMGVDMIGTSAGMIWLAGSYEVPFRSIGALLNAALAQGIAHRTLENFLEDVSIACQARIDEREQEFMRYTLFQHGGR